MTMGFLRAEMTITKTKGLFGHLEKDRVGGLPLVGNPSSHTTEHTDPYTAVR